MFNRHNCPLCQSPFWTLRIFNWLGLFQSCPHDRAIANELTMIERRYENARYNFGSKTA